MPENYVIFITEHDVLDGNKPVYHTDRTIRETGDLFGDGSHILYVNGSWRDESPIGRLMYDFSCTNPDDMNYALLADRVRYFKEDKEGVQTMCKIIEDYAQEVAKEVAKETEERKLLSDLKTLMETMNFSTEQAMDALRVPANERDHYKARL